MVGAVAVAVAVVVGSRVNQRSEGARRVVEALRIVVVVVVAAVVVVAVEDCRSHRPNEMSSAGGVCVASCLPWRVSDNCPRTQWAA